MRLTPPDPPLDDGVVRLRALRPSDAPAYAAAFADDPDLGFLAGIPEEPDEPAALRRIEEELPGFAERGTAIELAVAAVEDDRFLGTVILWRTDWSDLRSEVGLWLARDARSGGAGRRALVLLCDWAFTALRLERLVLETHADNAPMRRVAERAGFVEEGLLREHEVARGARHSMAVYGLLAREWHSSA